MVQVDDRQVPQGVHGVEESKAYEPDQASDGVYGGISTESTNPTPGSTSDQELLTQLEQTTVFIEHLQQAVLYMT